VSGELELKTPVVVLVPPQTKAKFCPSSPGKITLILMMLLFVRENLLDFNDHVGQWFLVLKSRFHYFQKFGTLGYTLMDGNINYK